MTADTAPADRWQRIALDPPRAWGETPVSGALRVELADFHVEERLGFAPDGGEAHRLLLVEKAGANTLFVARAIAVRAGIARGERRIRRPEGPACHRAPVVFRTGNPGHGVVRRLFGRGLPRTRGAPAFAQAQARCTGGQPLPHPRAWPAGRRPGHRCAHRAACRDGRAQLLRAAALRPRRGEPRARAAVARERPPAARPRAARIPAVVRAFARIQCRAVRARLGEHLESPAAGRGREPVRQPVGVRAEHPDEGCIGGCRRATLRRPVRCAAPAACLPGGEAARIEAAALADVAPIPGLLAAVGMRGERRALVLRPGRVRHRLDGDTLEIEFELAARRICDQRPARARRRARAGAGRGLRLSEPAARKARRCRRRCGAPNRTRPPRRDAAASD